MQKLLAKWLLTVIRQLLPERIQSQKMANEIFMTHQHFVFTYPPKNDIMCQLFASSLVSGTPPICCTCITPGWGWVPLGLALEELPADTHNK